MNTYITEDYVDFEVAKLLREKGFEFSSCSTYYTLHGEVCEIRKSQEIGIAPRPTLQMAMKWLREVHNIDIDIEAAVGMLGIKVYVPHISTYKTLEDDPSKVRQIKRGIHYKDDHWVIPALQYFDSYEEAVKVALKYCLENLI